MAKKILIVGGKYLEFHVEHLNLSRPHRFRARLLDPARALKALKEESDFDAIVLDLDIKHGAELDMRETENGELTGAIVVKKFRNAHPHSAFVLIDGAKQKKLKESGNVIFVSRTDVLSPEALYDWLDDFLAHRREHQHAA